MKKRYIFLLILSGLSIFSLLIILLIIKTGAYLPYLEAFIKEKTGKTVEIGGIEITRNWNIRIRGLKIGEDSEDGLSITIPLILIKGSIKEMIGRSFEEIIIEQPIFILLVGSESYKSGGFIPPERLPVVVDMVAVHEGIVIIKDQKGIIRRLSSINLTLKRVNRKYSHLRGRLKVSGVDSSISFKAVLNLIRPSIKEVHIEADSVKFPPQEPLRLKNVNISGEAGLKLTVRMDEIKKADIHMILRGLVIKDKGGKVYLDEHNGEVNAVVKESAIPGRIDFALHSLLNSSHRKEDNITAEIEGSYNLAQDELFLTTATIGFNKIGNFYISGQIRDIRSDNPRYDMEIKGKRIRLSGVHNLLGPFTINPKGIPHIDGILTGRVSLKGLLKDALRWSSEMTIRKVSIRSDNMFLYLVKKRINLSSKGIFEFKNESLLVDFLSVSIKDLLGLDIKGLFKGLPSGKPDIDSSGTIKIYNMEGLRKIVITKNPSLKVIPAIKGGALIRIYFKGELNSPEIKGTIRFNGKEIKAHRLNVGLYAMKIPFSFKNKTLVLGPSQIKADMVDIGNEDPQGMSEGYSLRLTNVEINIPTLKIKEDQNLSGDILFSAGDTLIQKGSSVLIKEKDIRLSGRISAHLKEGDIVLNDLLLNTERIHGLTSMIKILFKKDKVNITGDMKYSSVLNRGILADLLSGLHKKGFQIEGVGSISSSFSLKISRGETPDIKAIADFTLKDGVFSTPDGDIVSEGIYLSGHSMIETPSESDVVGIDIEVKAKNFEILAGSIYGDFRERPVTFHIRGRYKRGNDSLEISEAALNIKDIGGLYVQGILHDLSKKPRMEIELRLPWLSIRGLYEDYIKDAYRERFPLLGDITVSGNTELFLSLKGPLRTPEVHGNMRLTDIDITGDEKLYLKGINMHLPLHKGLNVKEYEGSLSIKEASIGGVKINDLEMPLIISDDDIIFKKPIVMKLLGGDIFIDNINFRKVTGSDRLFQASLRLEKIDLSRLSRALHIPPLKGYLSGTIPDIVYTDGSIYTDGDVVINVFDGVVKVKNLAVHNIMSPALSIESDIEVDDISLSELTQTFDTGHISGVLRGFIKDLVIVNGQPQHFKASFETVKKRGVPQRISVRALKRIQILGSGMGSSILDRGIYQFFKQYRYAKIGFRAYLNNDLLTLEGIEKDGNRGYIVKGGLLPPKVDVINYTQNISFRELIDRLKRIRKIEK
jgi:hypothetical protein